MNVWMNEYMNKWMNEWMNEWMNDSVHGGQPTKTLCSGPLLQYDWYLRNFIKTLGQNHI